MRLKEIKLDTRVGKLNEAITKIPVLDEDFDALKLLMSKPIPAVVAHLYINQSICDDELDDTISRLAESEPDRDMRPFIAEWIDRVMPDQKYRFRDAPSGNDTTGNLSLIHGYHQNSTPKR